MTTRRKANNDNNDGKSLDTAILLEETDDEEEEGEDLHSTADGGEENSNPNPTTKKFSLDRKRPAVGMQEGEEDSKRPAPQQRQRQFSNNQDFSSSIPVVESVASTEKSITSQTARDSKNYAAAVAAGGTITTAPSSSTPIPPGNIDCPIKLFATQQDTILRRKSTKNHSCWTQCWTLREMLGLDRPNETNKDSSSIEWLVISNYLIDFEVLVNEVPELLSIPTTLVVYGSKDTSEQAWISCASKTSTIDVICRDPSQPSKSTANPLNVKLPWGCHHTKLFLVGYTSGRLRIIIHTANLRYSDIHFKTQGAYIEDFWPKTTMTPSSFSSSSLPPPPDFEVTLLAYLKTYHHDKKYKWKKGSNNNTNKSCTLVELLQQYDFSSAKGILIPSAPGYYKPKDFHKWGYLKLSRAIALHTNTTGPSPRQPRTRTPSPPIVCQFSSIGSLSKKYLTALETAWDMNQVHSNTNKNGDNSKSHSGSKKKSKQAQQPQQQDHNLCLVYPTRNEIVHSVEGIVGGGSVPGRRNNVLKPFLQSLYHKWTSPSSFSSSSSVPLSVLDSDDEDENDDDNPCQTAVMESSHTYTDPLNKARNVPHIKTYYQPTSDGQSMAWFVLASQNLSKAAWGEVQNGQWGETLKIFHWELGVFLAPKLLGGKIGGGGSRRLVPYHQVSKSTENDDIMAIPLPYKFHPTPYSSSNNNNSSSDQPWTVD